MSQLTPKKNSPLLCVYRDCQKSQHPHSEFCEDHIPSNTPCPLCEGKLIHYEVKESHVYSCLACPFVGFEFYNDDDLNALTIYLNRSK
jgi:hypothetical protein